MSLPDDETDSKPQLLPNSTNDESSRAILLAQVALLRLLAADAAEALRAKTASRDGNSIP